MHVTGNFGVNILSPGKNVGEVKMTPNISELGLRFDDCHFVIWTCVSRLCAKPVVACAQCLRVMHNPASDDLPKN